MARSCLLFPLLALALLAAFGLTGCEKVDPNTVEYQLQELKEKKTKTSITTLGEMKAKEAVGPLMEAYEAGRFRYDIVAALAQIGDPAGAPVMIKAIGDTSEKAAAQLAGSTLMEWNVGEGNTDAMLAVVQDPAAPNENRFAALQVLSRFPDPKTAPALVKVLKADPDLQPMALAGLAAEGLGKLKYEKAIAPLVSCMWMDDALGRNAVGECRLALNRIGPPAVPAVIQTLERKNRAVEKRATKLKFDKGGLVEAKAADLLGDLPDPAAVEPLIVALKTRDEMPPSIANNPQKAQVFVMSGVQRVISSAKALAAIGDERAVAPMIEIAANKELALEYKLAAVQQLGFLGSPKAVDGLLDLLDDDVNQYDPVSQGFRLQLALAIANIIPADAKRDLAKFEKVVEGIKKETGEWIGDNNKKLEEGIKDANLKQGLQRDIKSWNEQLESFKEVDAKLAVVKECAADTACYAGKLADANVAVQLLAVYRLSNAADESKGAAAKALLDRTEALLNAEKPGKDDPVVLNAIMFGIGRTGSAANVERVTALQKLASDKAETTKNQMYKGAFKGVAYTLDLLAASLGHR